MNASCKVVGGPFTRFDPGNPDRKSCLDLAIVSKELSKYVYKLTIDKHLAFTPGRPISKKKIIYSDHRSSILEFRNIPLKIKANSVGVKFSMWNTNKVGGWDVFKAMTENNEKLENAAIENEDTTKAMKVIGDELTKVKFKAFGKVKVSNTAKANEELEKLQKKKCVAIMDNKSDLEDELEKIDIKMAENLLCEQRNFFEKEIKHLKDLKYRKGKSASIFSLKNKVVGAKKVEQEATVIKNPKDDKVETEPTENFR